MGYIANKLGLNTGTVDDTQFRQQLSNLAMKQQQEESKKPKPGFLLRNAPVIGSIVGGTLGAIGGPVGSLAGATIGGGLGETAKEYGSNQNLDIGNIAKESAYGLAGELTGMGAARLVGGVGKIALEGGAKRLSNMAFKETVKDTRAAIRGGKTLGEEALARGTKGFSEEQIYQNSVNALNKYEDMLQTQLSSSKRTVPISEITQKVNHLVQKYLKAGNTTAAKNITTRLEALKSAHGDSIPIDVANEVKRTLYDEARNGYGQLASEYIEGLKAIAKSIKESIANKVKGVAEINKELSYHGRVADAMISKMATSRNNLFGLDTLALGAGGLAGAGATGGASLIPAAVLAASKTVGGQTMAANALKGIVKVGEKLAPIGRGTARIAGQSVVRFGQTPAETTLPINSSSDLYSSQNVSTNRTNPIGLTQEDVGRAMLADLKSTGGKNIPKLDTISKYLITGSNKPMTQSQSAAKNYGTRIAQANTIFDTLEPVVASQLTGKGSFARMIPDRLKGTVLKQQEQAERNFINAVLRRESGAVISPSEFKSAALQYFPQPGDTFEVLNQKRQNRMLVQQNFLQEASALPASEFSLPTSTAQVQF